ncbi:MAG: TCP-1/cpn60 chaperonin family protein [Armatimonadota bacterium]|jgi:chaperonin GroEL (HSP60 family)
MSSSVKQVSKTTEVDERLAALATNSSAISSLSTAVEGTIGPKGLDCMLVDKYGDVTVTNDGATILDKIDTSHPAAKMLIRAARAQEEEIGDGTTTTTILAAALIAEGVGHVSRGVPVAKIIEGMRIGIRATLEYVESISTESDVKDDSIRSVALVAARGNSEIADLIVSAARTIGEAGLYDAGYKLGDSVVAKEGADSEVFCGIIIDKQRTSKQMPTAVENPLVLIVDDAVEAEAVANEALGTESGFASHIALQTEFRKNVQKIINMGVKFVAAAKGIDPAAEELFVDAGVMAVRRLSSRDIAKLTAVTGAKTIKKAGFGKTADELKSFVGRCDRVYEDEKLDHIRVIGGRTANEATVLIGASTREVKDERERVAKDAAGAVQAAVVSGVVAGGGAAEIAAMRHVHSIRENAKGMAAYGIDAVVNAFKKPLGHIVANAGFNPLEKVEELIIAQQENGSNRLGIDCDTGEIVDMVKLGVLDPTSVKLHALKTAAEIAEAILRINTIIRKRDEEEPNKG